MCDLRSIVEELVRQEATGQPVRDEMPELPPQPIAPTPINLKNAG